MYTTLISVAELDAQLPDPGWVVVDCRFDLSDTSAGRAAYLAGHIPGAVYAHLDETLSGPVQSGKTGRHPLPDPEVFADTLSRWGIDGSKQVVAYDDRGGPFAARLWWMLRWMGHPAVAVLDGGWPAWSKAGYATQQGDVQVPRTQFQAQVRQALQVEAGRIAQSLQEKDLVLVDARAAPRYRGEEEPLDPVAGHIPGALSLPFTENLGPDLHFKPREVLQAQFAEALDGRPAEAVVCYCGSGVTAAHNLLALTHAGFEGVRLYAGSWSEWITDPDRPVAVGA